MHEVAERDQRVRLAAAVGQLQLPDGLVVLAGQAQYHVPDQAAQVVRRERQREEFVRLLVDRPLAPLHDDLVEVGGEHVQREFPRLQVISKLDHFVPRFPR